MKDCVSANRDVLGANEKMLDAVGLKTEAAKAKATAEALTDSPTKGNLSDADKAVDEGTKALTTAIGAKPRAFGRIQGSVRRGSGLARVWCGQVRWDEVVVQTFSTGLKDASVLEAGKLQAGAYVAQTFPGNMTNLGKTMKSAVDFAKSSDIPVPAGTDDVMAALGGI